MNITSDCFILYLLLSYQSHCQQKKQEPPRPKFGFLPHSHTIGIPMDCKTMITIFVEESNPLTPNFYNNLINSLQFHRLTCTCGHSACLSIHGYYTRSLKTPEGKRSFRICRVICSCCHHTHALLPSSMVPYSQISMEEHVEVISCHETKEGWEPLMHRNPSIDEGNCRYIVRSFLKHWKQRLLSGKITLSDRTLLIRDCFTAFSRQFMQIRCTPNILFMNTT